MCDDTPIYLKNIVILLVFLQVFVIVTMFNQIVDDKNTSFREWQVCWKRNRRGGWKNKGLKYQTQKSVFPNCYLTGVSDIHPCHSNSLIFVICPNFEHPSPPSAITGHSNNTWHSEEGWGGGKGKCHVSFFSVLHSDFEAFRRKAYWIELSWAVQIISKLKAGKFSKHLFYFKTSHFEGARGSVKCKKSVTYYLNGSLCTRFK